MSRNCHVFPCLPVEEVLRSRDGQDAYGASITIPYAGAFDARDERDRVNARRTADLVRGHPDAFERTRRAGHVTASAFVVDAAHDHVVLTHHAKLDCWLQLGGHCDGVRDPLAVALREAREESGLTAIRMARRDVFDIDIHEVPAHGDMPPHLHYDVRYLLVADISEPLRQSAESRDLAWVPLSRLADFTDKPSVLVLKRKLERP